MWRSHPHQSDCKLRRNNNKFTEEKFKSSEQWNACKGERRYGNKNITREHFIMIIIFRRRESSPYEWSLLKCFARSSSVQPEKASFRQWKSLKFHPSLAVGVFAQLFVVNVCEWSRARLEKERGKKKRALEQELQILRQFLLSRGPQFAVRPGNYLFRWNIDVAWEFSEAISSLPIDRSAELAENFK